MFEFVDQYLAENSTEGNIYVIYDLSNIRFVAAFWQCLLIFHVDFQEPFGGKNNLHLSYQDVTDFV